MLSEVKPIEQVETLRGRSAVHSAHFPHRKLWNYMRRLRINILPNLRRFQTSTVMLGSCGALLVRESIDLLSILNSELIINYERLNW